MTAISPLFDAGAAGSLANATLCAASRSEMPATPDADDFDEKANPADAPRPAMCRARWRRVVDTLLSPISGPTLAGR